MCLELPPQIGPDPPDRSEEEEEEEEERREGGVESCALLMHKDGYDSEDTILILKQPQNLLLQRRRYSMDC